MKAMGLVRVLVCAVATMLAFPVVAAAKPGYLVSPPYFSFFADLPKSNGYTAALVGGHREVAIIFDRHGETALYFVKGRANRHGIDADFGRFGSVHARFTEHRQEREPLFPGCRGRRRIEVQGHLEGTLRFRGEGGFATVSSNRMRASYERGFKETCHSGPESKEDDQLIDVLEATGKTAAGTEVDLRATRLDSIDMPLVSASIFERIGRVLVLKRTLSTEQDSILEFSPAIHRPKTVTLGPTSPFRGSALYSALPDGKSEWSGDLRAPFAGLGMVSLTGPGFHADACRIRFANQSLTCAQQRARRGSAHADYLVRRLPRRTLTR